MHIQPTFGSRALPSAYEAPRLHKPERIALVLRIGLGLVILSGGWAKLLHLLDPARQEAFVSRYLSADGYVNQFFVTYLFESAPGSVLSPWLFLTTLSALELVSGAALIAGLLVRPQALLWGLMFWSFLAALPVVTASGATIELPTHTTPALLVLVRDIGLSGMFFVLFNIGAGRHSLDERLFGPSATRTVVDWDNLGLLLRVSVAAPLLVGGAFAGLPHIQTFSASAGVLIALSLLLLTGIGVRGAGMAVAVLMLWHLSQLVRPDMSVIALMNAWKREFAFLAAASVLGIAGGGRRFTLWKLRGGVQRLVRPGELEVTHTSRYVSAADTAM